MTELGSVSVKLDADTGDFEKGMKSAEDALKSTAKVAAAAFAGLSVAIGVSVAAASKQIEAELQLSSAFKATGKEINTDKLKDLASELQKVTTFGDETTIAAMAMFARFGAGEETISALTPRIQDFSTAMSMDLKTATLLVGKAFTGQTGTLSRYGIVLSDTEKKTLTLGNEQQKMAILAKILDSRFKGSAQIMAQTASGALKQLKNAMGDVVEQIGFLFDAPLSALFRAVTSVVSKLGDAFKGLSDTAKKWIGTSVLVVTAITGITAAVSGLTLVLPVLKASFLAVGKTIWASLAPVLPIFAAIAAAVAMNILLVGAMRKAWDSNLGGIQEKVTWWKNEFTKSFELIGDAAKWLIGAFVKGWKFAVDAGVGAWNAILTAVEKVVDGTLRGIEKIANALADTAFGEMLGLGKVNLGRLNLGVIKGVGGADEAMARLEEIFDAVVDFHKDAAGTTAGIIGETWGAGVDTLKDLLASLGISFDDLKKKIDDTGGAVSDIPEIAKPDTIGELVGGFDGVTEAAKVLGPGKWK
ncbi:MAG: hypothetical protein ACXADY_25935, partial [Candidatus Hodarchaeales archaeon]